MADSFIQLPADGAGKKLASETWTQGGDGTVHGQKLLICDENGNVVGVTSNKLDVNATGTVTANNQADDTVTDSLTSLNDTVTLPLSNGVSSVSAYVTGTMNTGSIITPELSNDGTNWTPAAAITQGALATSLTNSIQGTFIFIGLKSYVIATGGFTTLRFRLSTFNSGDDITVILRGRGEGTVNIGSPVNAIGDTQHDAANTAAAVQIGGHATTDAPSAVAAGDRVRAWFGLHGEQKTTMVRPWHNLGDYRAVTAALAHAASADAANVGRWYLINPVGSSVAIAVLRVYFYHAITSAAAHLTIPRITLDRFTFTGTASGASLTPSKRVRTTTQGQTADATNVGSVRTAATGMTITQGEVEHAALPPTALTGVGASANSYSLYGMSERGEDSLILAPGEGLMCRQADASATGRSWLNTIDWSEFTA